MLELSLLALLNQPVNAASVAPPSYPWVSQVRSVAKNLVAENPVAVSGPKEAEGSTADPDRLFFAVVNSLFSITPNGSDRKLLRPPLNRSDGSVDEFTGSSNGHLAAVFNYSEVYVWHNGSTTATPVFKSQCPYLSTLDLLWTSSGKTLLIKESCNAPTSTAQDSVKLYVSDTQGLDGTRPLTALPTAIDSDLSISPDGSQVAFVQQGQIYRLKIGDPRPQPVTRDAGVYGAAGSPLAWSPDSSKLAFYEGNYPYQRLYVINADGRDRKLLTPDPNYQIYRSRLFWSPDSRSLAFYQPADPPYSNQEIIERVDVSTGTLTPLTQPGLYDALSWSPDSQKLVFAEGRIESQKLYVLDLATQNLTPLTPTPMAQVLQAQWSIGGNWIAFTAEPSDQALGNQILYSVQPDGSGLRSLTDPNEYVYPFTWQSR